MTEPKYPYKHGMSRIPEYGVWQAMKNRCYRPTTHEYERYGGRGITVCARWLDSFQCFIEDMGRRPSSDYSIDRINNDGNYAPKNCRWATREQQLANKSNSRSVMVGGQRLSFANAARNAGVNVNTLATRVYRGMSPELALHYRNPRSTNPSGSKGVYYIQSTAKWLVQVRINGRQKHLGVFATLEEAKAALNKAGAT